MNLVVCGSPLPANCLVCWKREWFNAILMMCITFPDEHGEVSTQVTGYKIWPRIGW
jgi:hypothetical protein